MRKLGPKHRICRRVGEAVCGRPNCPVGKRPYPPGQHGQGRRRLSEFHIRLLEKQKLRAMYGVQEKDAVTGRLVRVPERSEIPLPVQVDERLIVELMS